uniref:Uncharacterized protein n=1 Tax=Anguilla anguilla TaxID=7936 RepID=A0A0E9UBL8_ANGAN
MPSRRLSMRRRRGSAPWMLQTRGS